MTEGCTKWRDEVIGLLEGTADETYRTHLVACDACRDASHSLERLAGSIARAGDDFVVSTSLVERLEAIAKEACPEETSPSDTGDRVSQTRVRTPHVEATAHERDVRRSKKGLWLLLVACASAGVSSVVGLKMADRQRSPDAALARAWHGKVSKVAFSGPAGGPPGLMVVTAAGKTPLAEGAEIASGMHVATDGRTRARLSFDDGSVIVLDRATDITVESAPRTIAVNDGALLADVAHVDGAPWAKVKTPNGEVKVLGTKFSVTTATDRTNVEVLRGEVEVASGNDSHKITAGQEGVIGRDGKVDVAQANDLAQRAAFGEQLLGTHNEDTEPPASGLGELRAKRPGRTDEKDHAVRLQKHAVKVRIAGNVARTEIDETFANDTDDELEGIYRFPLPPGAQIERLALEVDGKLLDGEFIDKAKASAIWRGAIQNAAPKAPKPKEEIVWVPGPWHDPALLEWQRGGRFELRIFPIPKRGSRRVVIAYTETVQPVAGLRRYVYPLPQGASSKISMDQFSLDAQVLGHDTKVPVGVRGYELERKTDASAERLSTTLSSFVPSGDLAIEYALDDKATDATVWAYRDEAKAALSPANSAEKAKQVDPIGADPFVAIALRPKLPRWSESKPRDQVIVVDAGRTMYGERFARAKRLAVQMAQEMDRRDRVTVIACDVTCKALPGGFVAPGAPSAHDIDAFLKGVTPEGASDLVGAVRAASKLPGHDGARDLRISVLSVGMATAGYRSVGRVASEVADALHEPRSLVVTVPIGVEADVQFLSDVARGGGGVVVPYQPGQRLEATALEVLNATYGTTLRDVEVVLPEGLHDVAPATLPPLRAGSETIVAARMSSESVKGDIILRGKVGGEPFEAKYPIEASATTDAGNAFVPRLFAAARIADRERQPGDAARGELVALSRRFSVPSRATSLLVLESEAMFSAFGIERAEHGPSWTGEALAQGQTIASSPAPAAEPSELSGLASMDDASGLGASSNAEFAKKGEGGLSSGVGRSGGFAPAPAPTTTAAPKAAAPARRPAQLGDFDSFDERRELSRPRGPRSSGQFMKKVYVRRATLRASSTPSVPLDKIAQARAAVASAPDERSKHKDLARLLALSGQLDELGETLDKWSSRDPLDVDVIVSRADVAARRGDRDTSLRILGGALAASSLGPADAFVLAQSLARSYERLGRPEACAFYVTAAELRPGRRAALTAASTPLNASDVDSLARAISCERQSGVSTTERWLEGMSIAQRNAVNAELAKLPSQKGESAFGDIVVSATWNGGVDLDVAILDPAGRRAGAVTRMKSARVEGAVARDHEAVALSSGDAGSFLVEIARTDVIGAVTGRPTSAPVTGTVTIKAFGQTQSMPFTLTGARTQVGRVDVRWDTELVPLNDSPVVSRVFDHSRAASALAAVN
ncbi:MAG TPA: VIT domain-containing protein, partial [Labilithrix sp.]|nr:VIT domain-containing protein [Labilithrix sp.]